MRFTATKEEVLAIAANAVNASKSTGFIRWIYKPVDMDLFDGNLLQLGLVDDIVVNLSIEELASGEFEIEDVVDPRYQTWAETYPTVEALVGSVLGCMGFN